MSDKQSSVKLVAIAVKQTHFVEVDGALSDSEAVEAAICGAPTESLPSRIISAKIAKYIGDQWEEGDEDDE